MKQAGYAVGVILGALLMGGTAWAGDSYWGSGSGQFGSDASWESGGVPGSGDHAHFNNNASYTVTWTASATNAGATFDAPGGLVTLNAGAYTWTMPGVFNVGPSATAATTVRLDGGTYAIHSLQVTNVTAGGAGTSFLQLKKGTLVTTGDSTIRMSTNGVGTAQFMLGAAGVSGDVFTWKITNGTTRLFTPGPGGENQSSLYVGRFNQHGKGILNLNGAGTVLTNLNQVYVGDATYGNPGNTLTISNSAKLYVSGTFWVGRSCINNQVAVNGVGSLLKSGYVYVGKNGAGVNSLTVTNGARVESGGFTVEEGGRLARIVVTGAGSSLYSTGNSGVGPAGGATSNLLLIADGASVYNQGNLQFGKSATAWSPNNRIVVTGSGTTFTNMGNFSYEGTNQNFRVADGARVFIGGSWSPGSVRGRIEVADPGSHVSAGAGGTIGGSMTLVVTNGGTYVSRSGALYLGNSAGPGASVRVTGSGSTYTATGSPFRVASVTDARLTVDQGGQFTQTDESNWGIGIGYAAGKTGTVIVAGANSVFGRTGSAYGDTRVGEGGVGRLAVTNQATFWTYSRSGLSVGNAAGAAGSTALVADGGLLEWRRQPDSSLTITVGDYAGNWFTNRGGILQFAYPNPVVTPGAFGRVVIDGGTVSFRGIANADVRCNQSGFGMDSTTRVKWLGANGYRLNTATNVANANQAYTFAVTGDPANFARLELLNGSLWRGGNATIGSGGALVVGTGVNAVATDLTFTPGGTLRVTFNGPGDFSRLTASGAVNLGGATLHLTLGAEPERNIPYPIIETAGAGSISGEFGNGTFTASYGGTDYEMSIRHGTQGVSIIWPTRGTVLILR